MLARSAVIFTFKSSAIPKASKGCTSSPAVATHSARLSPHTMTTIHRLATAWHNAPAVPAPPPSPPSRRAGAKKADAGCSDPEDVEREHARFSVEWWAEPIPWYSEKHWGVSPAPKPMHSLQLFLSKSSTLNLESKTLNPTP